MQDLSQLRKVRIKINDDLDIAAIDTIGTVIISIGVAKYFNWNELITVGSAFGLGIIFHNIFKQKTPLNKYIHVKAVEGRSICKINQ